MSEVAVTGDENVGAARCSLAALHPGVDPAILPDQKTDHDHCGKGSGEWCELEHGLIILQKRSNNEALNFPRATFVHLA